MSHDLQIAPPITPAYLTEEAAAAYLSVSRHTLESWRHRGLGPAYVRLGTRSLRYRREDLDAFATRVAPTKGA